MKSTMTAPLRYRPRPCTVLYKTPDVALVSVEDSHRVVVNTDSLYVLFRWRKPTTLEEFAESYSRTRYRDLLAGALRIRSTRRLAWLERVIVEIPTEVVKNTAVFRRTKAHIEELLSANLLVEATSQASFNVGDEGVAAPCIRVVIPTCNRPQMLERLLDSLAANCRRYGHRIEVLVGDSSTNEECQRANERVLMMQHSHFEGCVYVGAAQRQVVVNHLTQSGIDPDVAHFTLIGEGHRGFGAARNLLLLLNIGQRFISCDDDILLRGRCLGDTKNAVGASKYPPCLLLTDVESESLHDFIGDHLAFLGANIQDLASGEGASLDGACSHLRYSEDHGKGSICYTISGSIGDSGMYSALPMILCRHPHSESALASGRYYERLQRDRIVSRSVDCVSITHRGPVATMCYAHDTMQATVPFMPSFRNEDGLLGRLIRIVFPVSFWAHLPHQVVHVPEKRRDNLCQWTDAVVMMRMSELLLALLDIIHTDERWSATRRMEAIGMQIVHFSKLSRSDFSTALDDICRRHWIERLGALDSILARKVRLAPALTQDILATRIRLFAKLTHNDVVYPIELEQFVDASAKELALRRFLMRFGNLLSSWTNMTNIMQARNWTAEMSKRCNR